MKILGIDLATKTGWADRSKGRPTTAGVQDFSTRRHEGGGMRFLRFRRWLETEFLVGEITCVGYEEVARHAGTHAAHIYGGLLAELSALCEDRNIPYMGFPVQAIKRCATGKGGGKGTNKEAMIASAQLRWPTIDIIDDNVADALWVSEVTLKELNFDVTEW